MSKITASKLLTVSMIMSMALLAYMTIFQSDKYLCVDDCVNEISATEDPSGTAFLVSFQGPVMQEQSHIFMKKLMKVREHIEKGDRLIVSVESPGGSMVLGNRAWAEIQDIKNDGVVVVTITESYALSAGYLILSTGHRILSTDGALIGNVGVYNKVVRAKKSDPLVVGSSRTKELFGGDGIRNDKDVDILRSRIMEMNTTFRTRILENRLGKITDKETAFNGTPYDSRKAIMLGLSDGHASLRDVLSAAARNGYNVKTVFSRREMGLYF